MYMHIIGKMFKVNFLNDVPKSSHMAINIFTAHISFSRFHSSLNLRQSLLKLKISLFISVINQLDVQNFCFTITLFHVSACFEHMCSSSGDQNCITQPLVSSH